MCRGYCRRKHGGCAWSPTVSGLVKFLSSTREAEAHPEATNKPRIGPPKGGLFDAARPSHRWWVAATVMVSGFLVPMSQTAMQVALPQMMTVFGLDLDQAQWIVTAYVIAGAMLVPAVGWLGNRLGNRTFYVLCLSFFVTNSALCALSWSGSSLIAFRILQGLGGGPIPP
jgi:MFS transporter